MRRERNVSSSVAGPCGARSENQDNQGECVGAETNGNVIAPADPAAEAFMQATTPNPFPPSRLDNSLFEERTGEQERGQKKGFCNVEDGYGVPAQKTKNLGWGGVGVGGDDIDGRQGGQDGRNGDKPDAGANDRGSIAGEGRRRPGGGREVEREDI